jgi:hypothetical protein
MNPSSNKRVPGPLQNSNPAEDIRQNIEQHGNPGGISTNADVAAEQVTRRLKRKGER